ncbi:MAG: HAD-IC family P-type ATPase, partial [Gammaproteobacteria bacterium]
MNNRQINIEDATEWHALTAEACLQKLGADPDGLGDEEAQARLSQHGLNRLAPSRKRSALVRFMLQFHNVLVYVLLLAAIVTGMLAMWIDTAVIIGVILINATVGFLQEGRAERALEAVRNMLSPTATVVRNGQRVSIPAESLVPGDRVLLEAGDKVPADVRLLDAVRLQIDEAMLTGESVPASKSADPVAANALLGDRKCMAYSGTFVTGGQCSAVVVTTGEATELGRINTMLSEVHTLQTPLTRQMDQFGRWLTMAILIIAGATFAFGTLTPNMAGHGMVDLFMATVGLVVAAIPEGLPAIVTITLAIGVQRMARHNAIIRRLPAVETLGAVSTICSDKTGTLTRNEMMVQAVVTAAGETAVRGSGYAPEGELSSETGDLRDVKALAEAGLLCNDAALIQRNGHWQVEGDPTEGALVALAARA